MIFDLFFNSLVFSHSQALRQFGNPDPTHSLCSKLQFRKMSDAAATADFVLSRFVAGAHAADDEGPSTPGCRVTKENLGSFNSPTPPSTGPPSLCDADSEAGSVSEIHDGHMSTMDLRNMLCPFPSEILSLLILCHLTSVT